MMMVMHTLVERLHRVPPQRRAATLNRQILPIMRQRHVNRLAQAARANDFQSRRLTFDARFADALGNQAAPEAELGCFALSEPRAQS